MPEAKTHVRNPHWYWIPVRILAVTFPLTILSFALGLLLGIIGTAVGATLRGVPVNITFAYRHIASWAAGIVAAVTLISMTVNEVRYYRQAKTLAQIERVS